jgi:hypothetical protein
VAYLTFGKKLRERKRTHITLFEQNLLKFIAFQQRLSLEQIKRVYNYFYPIKLNTLKKKLNRWTESNILISYRNEDFTNLCNLYSIGRKGLNLLAGADHEKWLDIDPNEIKRVTNYSHQIGYQEVVINLLLHFLDHSIHFHSYRPRLIFEEDQKEYGMPDWFLTHRLNDGTLKDFYIEYDNNNMSHPEIRMKNKAYIKKALDNPDKDITLLYSLVEQDFHYRGVSKHSSRKRIANFKAHFLDDELAFPDNLTVNVHLLSRVSHVVDNLLIPKEKDNAIKLQALKDYFVSHYGYRVEEVLSDGFYFREVPTCYYADSILELYDHENKLVERIGIFFPNEGDIRSFQQVAGFYQMREGRLFTSTVHRLVLIYEDDISAVSDNFGIKFGKAALLTDVDSLRNNKEAPFRSFTGLNPTKKREYPFE